MDTNNTISEEEASEIIAGADDVPETAKKPNDLDEVQRKYAEYLGADSVEEAKDAVEKVEEMLSDMQDLRAGVHVLVIEGYSVEEIVSAAQFFAEESNKSINTLTKRHISNQRLFKKIKAQAEDKVTNPTESE